MNENFEKFMDALRELSERENTGEETVFSNTLDFLKYKDSFFYEYRLSIADPGSLFEERPEPEAMRRFYMDLFCESIQGAEARCFYDPEREDVLYLKIIYEEPVSVWTMIGIYGGRFPEMEEVDEDTLCMRFVTELEMIKGIKETESFLLDPSHQDQDMGGIHENAGYYENEFASEDE